MAPPPCLRPLSCRTASSSSPSRSRSHAPTAADTRVAVTTYKVSSAGETSLITRPRQRKPGLAIASALVQICDEFHLHALCSLRDSSDEQSHFTCSSESRMRPISVVMGENKSSDSSGSPEPQPGSAWNRIPAALAPSVAGVDQDGGQQCRAWCDD